MQYQADYLYEGVLGGNQITRVISSRFNEWLMKLTYEKVKERKGEIASDYFKKL